MRFKSNEYHIIRDSKLFSDEYYIKTNGNNNEIAKDPLLHFITTGVWEKRDPSPKINLKEIFDENPHLLKLKINPLVDMINKRNKSELNVSNLKKQVNDVIAKLTDIDRIEIIKNSVFFNEQYYKNSNKNINFDITDPARHYLEFGNQYRRNPSPHFHTEYYLSQHTDLRENALVHFEINKKFEIFISTKNEAWKEIEYWEQYNAIVKSELFSKDYYLQTYPDLNNAFVDAHMHYLEHGAFEFRNPSVSFSSKLYFEKYPVCRELKFNPLIHYEFIAKPLGGKYQTTAQENINKISMAGKNEKKIYPDLLRRLKKKHKIVDKFYYALMSNLCQQGKFSFNLFGNLLSQIINNFDFFEQKFILFFTNDVDPENHENKDGYYQRILSIDGAFETKHRLYVKYVSQVDHPDSYENHIKIIRYSNQLITIVLDTAPTIAEAVLKTLADICHFIYIHSVGPFRVNSTSNAVVKSKKNVFLDFHGVVPEEFRMYHWYDLAAQFEEYERIAVSRADKILCVTEKMKDHIVIKHNKNWNALINLPIYNTFKNEALNYKLKLIANGKKVPRVIYAGGAHKWQNTTETVKFLLSITEKASFRILTTEPNVFLKIFEDNNKKNPSLESDVFFANKDQLISEYRKSDYGICFRSPSLVNSVACPTKVIEYITFGIIPIFTFEDIGDFKKLGLSFLKKDDVLSKGFPDDETRVAMVKRNLYILEEIENNRISGLNELFEVADES